MCGIFGILDPAGLRGDPAMFLQGIQVAAHRGPDGQGATWFDTRATPRGGPILREPLPDEGQATLLLAHRRLSIVELSSLGSQPMCSYDRALWITFNGEIYNYRELREELIGQGARFRSGSDTEVILQAYAAWGPDAVKRFIGMWAFALLDLRQRRLILSRDRYGIKPLHWWSDGRALVFGSEIKQILALNQVPRDINRRVVYDYLQHEVADRGSETFFMGISKVRPATNLLIALDGGAPEETTYYSPPNGPVLEGIAPADAAARFGAALQDSVRLHLRADVPVGTCLSGGLDSGALALLIQDAAKAQHAGVERHAFTCHFDDPDADEMVFTRQSIAAAGVVPHVVRPTDADLRDSLERLVWHQDEPFASTSIFAQWSVFALVRQTGIKVVLDGQGADEILGGYASMAPHFFLELVRRGRWFAALRESTAWSRLQGRPWHALVSSLLGRRIGGAAAQPEWMRIGFAQELAPRSQTATGPRSEPYGRDAPFANLLHRFVFESNLPALLRYEDRNSMAFSVEARVPFLDHRLVELAFSLPSQIKFRDGYAKRVLRDAMHGSMPEEVRMRARKMGFATPEQRWQSTILAPMIEEALHGAELGEFVDPRGAREWLQGPGRANAGFVPWRWLNLALWRRQFAV